MKFCILLAVVLGLVSANHDPSFPFYPFTDSTNGSFLIANNSGKYGAVGVTKTSGAAFPDVVVACMTPKDTIECVGFKCSAADKCTEDAAVMKFALQEDKGVGAVTFTDVDFKSYSSILWLEAAAPSKLDATSVAGKTWEAHPVTLFTAKLEKSDFPYVVTVASDKKDETKIMIDSGASSFGAVGFRKDGNADFPVYVVMCTTSQDNCMDADCTDKNTCTIPTTSNLKTVTTDKKNGKWEVTTKSTSTLAAPSKFSLTASLKAAEVAKLEVAAIQGKTWKLQVVRTSNSYVVAPTFLALSALLFVFLN